MLGEVTCPSGELVLMDGGYLGLWSGDRSPDDVAGPDAVPSTDFEVVGPDADAAARSFDRQCGRTLYDIPQHGVADFTALFDRHCKEHGYDASLRAFERRVPHRERVRWAIAGGHPEMLVTGVPVIGVGGLPTDRPLTVTAEPGADGWWRCIRLVAGDVPVAETRELARIGVDNARFVFADADALNAWVHEESIDGLADVVFWGRDEDSVAAEFGAARTGTPGDDVYGWLNLPLAEAYDRAVALQDRRGAEPARMFAFDFRPHSHHWQVMAGVRGSAHEAATIEVGGARLMFAMTSMGDGFFPVHVEVDAEGAVVAIEVTVTGDES